MHGQGGVVGYGVIGGRLADGVVLQKDMELVGMAGVAPTLSVLAMKDRGMPCNLYCAAPGWRRTWEPRARR
jgi:glyceraldehyde-3-phosphate dehydrogenase (NAD(P))